MLYLIGQGVKKKSNREVLVQVLLNTEDENCPIGLTEGRGVGGVGGSFRPKNILTENKREFLKKCGAEWLITHCEQAVKMSQPLDSRAVLDTYEYINGKPPPLAGRD